MELGRRRSRRRHHQQRQRSPVTEPNTDIVYANHNLFPVITIRHFPAAPRARKGGRASVRSAVGQTGQRGRDGQTDRGEETRRDGTRTGCCARTSPSSDPEVDDACRTPWSGSGLVARWLLTHRRGPGKHGMGGNLNNTIVNRQLLSMNINQRRTHPMRTLSRLVPFHPHAQPVKWRKWMGREEEEQNRGRGREKNRPRTRGVSVPLSPLTHFLEARSWCRRRSHNNVIGNQLPLTRPPPTRHTPENNPSTDSHLHDKEARHSSDSNCQPSIQPTNQPASPPRSFVRPPVPCRRTLALHPLERRQRTKNHES